MNISTRLATQEDCALLLKFMRGLAKFEDYIDDFRVTEASLKTSGFPANGEPSFYAILAELDDHAVGMLVYYFIPFTYDLRPTFFIKELYVDPAARNQGIGETLFSAARKVAEQYQCGRLKWDVLHDNEAAKRFYGRQGARQDGTWQGYILEID